MREVVKQALLTMDCLPVEQSNFPPDYRTVQKMIEHKIAACEAVIHIVGLRYGVEPDPASLIEGAARRSYTQIEADIARQFGKRLYLFICAENFPYDDAPLEREELQLLQDAYRAEISKSKIVWTKVADRDELGRRVRELTFHGEEQEKTLGRERRRQARVIAQMRCDAKSTHRGIETIGEGLIALKRELQQGGLLALSDLTPEAIYKQLGLRLGMGEQEIAGLIACGKQSKDLSEQAAAALATLEFGEAESLYLQAAAAQQKNFVKAARDFLGAGRAASLASRFTEAIDYLERGDDALAIAGGKKKDFDLWFDIRFEWLQVSRQSCKTNDPAHITRALCETLEATRHMLAEISRSSAPDAWASVQSLLGDVLKNLGEHSSGEEKVRYLEQALVASRAVLEVRTLEKMPFHWLLFMFDQGKILEQLGEAASGEQSTQYLEQSAAAYRAAAKATNGLEPLTEITIRLLLGDVLAKLGEHSDGDERVRHIQESVREYRAVLKIAERFIFPLDLAGIHLKLGNLLTELGKSGSGRQGVQYLEEAVGVHKSAVELTNRDESPKIWAGCQFILGNVLQELGKRSSSKQSSTQYLEQSVAAYRAALEVTNREQMPQIYAVSAATLADALVKLAECSSGGQSVEYLKQSIVAYNSVLTIFTPQFNPSVNKFVSQKLEKAQEALTKISRQ